MDLTTKEYRTVTYISGPLLFLENANGDLEKALASFQEEDEGMEND